MRDARVVDLFAGTGALGIEALSRGAAHVLFVESNRALAAIIRSNLEAVGLSARADVIVRDVRRSASALKEHGPFDLALIDPPYATGLDREAVTLLVRSDCLSPGACIVVEHSSKAPPELPDEISAGLVTERTRTYGDTALTLYRAAGPSSEPEAGTESSPVETPRSEGAAMTRTAIYPGSFDPLTNGHHDVIKRSLIMFDRLVIAVAANVRKQALFDVAERVALIREVLGDDPRVEIDTFEGLLVEYAKRKGAVAVVRGLRAVADFEYEFEMASMNRRLAPSVETVFLMTHESYFYVSSHLVKEVAQLGGDVDAFVPPAVALRLRARIADQKKTP